MSLGSPLHRKQFAYKVEKSTETTLHNVVMRTENVIEHKEIAVGAFLDIEGHLTEPHLEQK
jgi:hypothetical protein